MVSLFSVQADGVQRKHLTYKTGCDLRYRASYGHRSTAAQSLLKAIRGISGDGICVRPELNIASGQNPETDF